jgi:hypothetical protein
MSFRVFLFLIVIGTIIAWTTWVMIIFNFDPTQGGILSFLLFYLSTFLAFSGLLFLIIYKIRSRFGKDQLLFYRLQASVRQAILFTILLSVWAVLQSQKLLRWWNLLILIIILALIEFFFLSLSKPRKNYVRPTTDNQDPFSAGDQPNL